MPEFTVMPVNEAQLRTLSFRQGMFMNEYFEYIQQLPKGQAGKLHVLEHENPLTIRRRLAVAAQALGAPQSSSVLERMCISGERMAQVRSQE
jgi:hypothetical protein